MLFHISLKTNIFIDILYILNHSKSITLHEKSIFPVMLPLYVLVNWDRFTVLSSTVLLPLVVPLCLLIPTANCLASCNNTSTTTERVKSDAENKAGRKSNAMQQHRNRNGNWTRFFPCPERREKSVFLTYEFFFLQCEYLQMDTHMHEFDIAVRSSVKKCDMCILIRGWIRVEKED